MNIDIDTPLMSGILDSKTYGVGVTNIAASFTGGLFPAGSRMITVRAVGGTVGIRKTGSVEAIPLAADGLARIRVSDGSCVGFELNVASSAQVIAWG